MNYYNENDRFAAAWLRELIRADLIADGEVDERSITDVRADDLRGFVQCHFFAGIGGWSYALRLAGWPDDRAVWTGSCPCQPFSSAGAQAGGNDPRDLWPVWFQLVKECRPVVVFGEQVETAIGHGWLDRLCDDLEREGYAVGACGLPATCGGAFHLRQRLYFVGARGEVCHLADPESRRTRSAQQPGQLSRPERSSEVGELGHAAVSGSGSQRRKSKSRDGQEVQARGPSIFEQLADPNGAESINSELQRSGGFLQPAKDAAPGFWDACDWLPCQDDKSRPVESGTFPLAHGIPHRVVKLRGYGNAIVPQVAAEVIRAYMEIEP